MKLSTEYPTSQIQYSLDCGDFSQTYMSVDLGKEEKTQAWYLNKAKENPKFPLHLSREFHDHKAITN